MWIIRWLSAFALLTFKTPVVRLTLFLCLGALSKTTATIFINHLPMDSVTQTVFSALQYLALAGFCFEVIRYVLIFEVAISIVELLEHFRRRKYP